MPDHAISPTRAQDYPEWYQQVVRAADLAEHLAALDGVDPDEVALDGWGGGFESREQNGNAAQRGEGDRRVDDPLLPLGFRLVWARDVHDVAGLFATLVPASTPCV